jgi:hypothetical protein
VFQPTELKNLSVCPCGFPLLREEIPKGTVYFVDFADRILAVLVCGGCRTHWPLDCVMVSESPTGKGGYLPVAAFL